MLCAICARETPDKYIEKHHLSPGRKEDVILVCMDCGDQIHKLFENRELRSQYDTLDKLKQCQDIIKWIWWIKKRKEFGTVCMKEKKKK